MVYGMMQRHDGNIEIISAPACGTCIRLTFPVREKTPQTAPAPAPHSEEKRSLRVLCVDDELSVRQFLKDCLTNFNHQVTVAANGGRAGFVPLRRAEHQPFDAVVTDLGMPEIDGHQVAKTVKAESPDTPVIMMTGWGTKTKEDGGASPQVDAMVGKPVRMQELNELLLRVTALTNAALEALFFRQHFFRQLNGRPGFPAPGLFPCRASSRLVG